MSVHIHAPPPIGRKRCRRYCPICKRRRTMLAWFCEWYGPSVTCLGCGEQWSDGQMCERPFMRGWRRKNIDAAKTKMGGEGMREELRKVVERLIRAGRRMSNLCFNLRQNELRVPLAEDRDSMALLFKEWDEAVAKYRAKSVPAKKRRPALSTALKEPPAK